MDLVSREIERLSKDFLDHGCDDEKRVRSIQHLEDYIEKHDLILEPAIVSSLWSKVIEECARSIINNNKLLIPPILSFLSTFQHLYGSSTCGIIYILYDSLFIAIQRSEKTLADEFHSLMRTILFNTPFSLMFGSSLLNAVNSTKPSAYCIKYIIEYIEIISTFPDSSLQFGMKYITNALVNLLPKAEGIDKYRIQEYLLRFGYSHPSSVVSSILPDANIPPSISQFSQLSISSSSSSSSSSSALSKINQSEKTSSSLSCMKEDGCLWFFFGSLLLCAGTILLLLLNLSPLSAISREKHQSQQISPNFDAETIMLSHATRFSGNKEIGISPNNGFDYIIMDGSVQERKAYELLVNQQHQQEYDVIYMDGFETSSYHSSEIVMGDGWAEERNDLPSSHVIELSMGESYSSSDPNSNTESSSNLILMFIVIAVVVGGFILRSAVTELTNTPIKETHAKYCSSTKTQHKNSHRKSGCIDFDKLDMSSVEQGEDSML